jgi:ABC-type transport system involved in cytochrome c biogenesis permease component
MKIAIILCILLTSMLAWAETFRDDFEDGGFCINPLYIILT